MSKLPIVLAFGLLWASQPAPDLRPLVAVTFAYSALASTQPAPAPSGQCKNCRGTGRVGDGRVSTVCPVCDGTGKEPAASAKPLCKDGKCPTSR